MKKINNSVLIALIIVGGILILGFLAFGFLGSNVYSETISSTGSSKIEMLPDFVGIYFNVQTESSTAKEASDKNSEIVNELKKSLLDLGLDDSEIKTQSFNVNPNYDWTGGRQKIIGYMASHSIKVEILTEEKDKVGEVIDAGIDAGSGISFISYEFTEENQKKYKAEAIKLATEDATLKAKAIAEGAGQKLGKLVSVSDSGSGFVPWVAFAEEDVAGARGAEIATQINPSEQEITATITTVFRIK